jgi:hypothetical protein
MLDLGIGTWSWRIVVRDPAYNRCPCFPRANMVILP